MNMTPDATATAVVPVLACVLNQLTSRNDRFPLDPNAVTKFHALRPPAISIVDYLERISKYAACSGECFVLALIYIDRIIQSNPTFVVNSLNIHRLLITSVMLGAKYFDDQYFNNAYYSRVGGVPCNEVNALEVEFLFMINFTLFVTTEQYSQYYQELHNHVLHSSCPCSRQGLRVPPLVLPVFPQCQPHEYVEVRDTGMYNPYEQFYEEEDEEDMHDDYYDGENGGGEMGMQQQVSTMNAYNVSSNQVNYDAMMMSTSPPNPVRAM